MITKFNLGLMILPFFQHFLMALNSGNVIELKY